MSPPFNLQFALSQDFYKLSGKKLLT